MTYAAAEARPPVMTEPSIMSEIEYYNDFRTCDFLGCEEPGLDVLGLPRTCLLLPRAQSGGLEDAREGLQARQED